MKKDRPAFLQLLFRVLFHPYTPRHHGCFLRVRAACCVLRDAWCMVHGAVRDAGSLSVQDDITSWLSHRLYACACVYTRSSHIYIRTFTHRRMYPTNSPTHTHQVLDREGRESLRFVDVRSLVTSDGKRGVVVYIFEARAVP